MKKTIVTDRSILKQKSIAIQDDREIINLIKDLEDSLDLSKGIGLSAVQIGVLKRVAIVRLSDKKYDLVNPEIIEKDFSSKINFEGCLSVPGVHVDTKRFLSIVVNNYDIETKTTITFKATGLDAIALQHEIDHMNGVIFLDRKWKSR